MTACTIRTDALEACRALPGVCYNSVQCGSSAPAHILKPYPMVSDNKSAYRVTRENTFSSNFYLPLIVKVKHNNVVHGTQLAAQSHE